MARILSLTCAAFIIWPVFAEQPSAPQPIAAPMRRLPWGQLNFMQTTDTHGWHAGHLQEAQYSADWGDYISFAERMRKKADDMGVDVLLVDTGDRVEGNGLYDASEPKGKYLYDIFKEQDIDIICTGNHELYQLDAAAREYTETVPNSKGKYIASNLDYINPETGDQIPMAQRFRKFTTKNQGIRILALGFLFDFTGNANNTVVQPVEKTILEPWFQEAIREDVDLFVVIGHVTLHGPEYKAIFAAIRSQNWDTPIQFFGGHSHIRDFAKYDSKAYGLQGGRYMETIGWMAIDGIDIKSQSQDATKSKSKTGMTFERRYIDTNLFGYHHHTSLNASTFPTSHGQTVSAAIHKARKALNLDDLHGCAPKDLWLNRAPYPSSSSLLTWLENEVVPAVVSNPSRKGKPALVLTNSGAMRFDIFKGAFTRDTTYIVSPFVSKYLYINDVPYKSAKLVLGLINQGGQFLNAADLQPSSVLAPPEQISVMSDILAPELPALDSFPASGSGSRSNGQTPLLASEERPSLVPGYTTLDALGNDGDDTIHAPISFYRVPNCIESRTALPSDEEPETVDLVFIDFIQPWVLLALRFTGNIYSKRDVDVYTQDTLTDLMVGWIRENWGKDC